MITTIRGLKVKLFGGVQKSAKEHFNNKRTEEGLEVLEPGSSPLVILEGIVLNSGLSGQTGMNKAQRIADGIQASSFLLSELTE